MSFCPTFSMFYPTQQQVWAVLIPAHSLARAKDLVKIILTQKWRAQGEEEGGKGGFPVSPVPGMVLCTGLTERGPKDPEVET